MPVRYSVEEIRRKYDEIAPRYDRMEWIVEVAGIARLRRRLFGRARGRVLDVATGTGKNLSYFPRDCRITAIDVSEGMLERARRRAAELKLDVDFRVMDAQALEFPDASFDTVTSSMTTCTFPDPLAALREMRRVCQPDGRVLLLEHGRGSWGWVGRLQDWGEEGHARRFACHWNREPHLLVQRAGMTIIEHRRHFAGVFHVIDAHP